MCNDLKRKGVVLSLENKLTRLAQGEMMTKLAKEYNVGNYTLTDLKKNESKIREFVTTMESLSVCPKERKIMRLAKDGQHVHVPLVCVINFTYCL